MINKHLDEPAIQNYLWDRSAISTEDLQHIRTCEHCMTRAEDYRLLFQAVQEVPKPTFDFDLAALVIQKLEHAAASEQSSGALHPVAPQKPTDKKSATPGWPAIAAIVCLLLVSGIPVYLFREELLEIASNASFMITWLIVMMVALIAVFLGIDEYRKYNQRINSLDIR